MKHFSPSNPIVNFKIACPKNGTLQDALIKAKEDSFGMLPGLAECHSSSGNEICARCLSCVTLMFFHDQEPDDLYLNPVAPLLSSLWKE